MDYEEKTFNNMLNNSFQQSNNEALIASASVRQLPNKLIARINANDFIVTEEELNKINIIKHTDYKALIVSSLIAEFQKFERSMMKRTVKEVFDDYYRIYVYTEIRDSMESISLDKIEWYVLFSHAPYILEYLYNKFVHDEYGSVQSLEEIQYFISNTVNYTLTFNKTAEINTYELIINKHFTTTKGE